MGIKEYISDLIHQFETSKMPQKFIDNNFLYDEYRGSLKNTSTRCHLSAIKSTDFNESFLLVYITEPSDDDEWEDLGYYFAFHHNKIELVEYDNEGFNIYETSKEKHVCTTKDEYFNLSIKFDLKFDFELIQYISEKFAVLKNNGLAKKYIIYYGIGEEELYGYK